MKCKNTTCRFHHSETDCELFFNISECDQRLKLEPEGSPYYYKKKKKKSANMIALIAGIDNKLN